MSVIKSIFVCEFITAGGLNHAALPPKLVHEGSLMRDALLRDLSTLPYRIVTSVDARLTPPLDGDCILIHAEDHAWPIWQRLMQAADAVWLIAPETDGLLAKLTGLAANLNKPVFGSSIAAITVTTSKFNTFSTLNRHNIKTVTTYTLQQYQQLADKSGQWVLKPDDGAGCEQTYYFDNPDKLAQCLNLNAAQNSVIQPYIAGQPGSISCVMHQGNARIFSCNQQLISIESGVFAYQGSIVNGFSEYWIECEVLAKQVAQALPDLAGYVGLDFVAVKNTEKIELVLVEINPRLTTSYVGLAASIGHNPAALIMDFMANEHTLWPVLQKHAVRVSL